MPFALYHSHLPSSHLSLANALNSISGYFVTLCVFGYSSLAGTEPSMGWDSLRGLGRQ